MASDESIAGTPGDQPTITEIECGGGGFVAHRTLNAVEMTVVAPDGPGFRTWIGADIAATTALQHVGAVLRLISGDIA